MQMRSAMLDKLDDIVSRIIEAYNPQKIVLFGSYARGDFVESSDIDLIVITETDKPFIKRLRDSAYIIPDAGVDILIYTPNEIRDFLEKGSAFIEKALREGKVLYEKGNCKSWEGDKRMGHLYTDVTVRGSKAAVKLKKVLIDTGATYTVLPERVLKRVGAARIPTETEIEVELGNGEKVKAKAYGVAIKIEEVEAPSISITFKGAQTVIGVETLESIGLKLDPTTGRLEFTRPKGMAYFY